jgi:5'-3' exoribonuclease 1
MGVPKFYRWISERYPCLSETVKEYQVCLRFKLAI